MRLARASGVVLVLTVAAVAAGCGAERAGVEPVNELAAAWSPDGRRLVIDHPRDGDTEIYVHGDGIEKLTDNEASDFYPSWSPDGRRIAFVSDREDGRPEVYVMDSNGSDQTRVTDSDDGVAGRPAWSPDSRRVALTELDCDDGFCTASIKIVELETGDTTTLDKREYTDTRDPSFARDGRLAFALQFGSEGIVVASADGRDWYARLRYSSAGWPAWSPDGRQIAYQCGYALCLANADGTGQRRLRNAPAERPAWSPDGRRIVYACGRPPGTPSGSKVGALCVLNMRNKSAQRLTLAWTR